MGKTLRPSGDEVQPRLLIGCQSLPQGGVGQDDRREAAIQAAYLDLIAATTPAQRRMHQEMMVALIRGRAPEVMELLERQRMERVGLL